MNDPVAPTVTGSFNLQAQMPHGKVFTVTGYLLAGDSLDTLNQRIDLLHDVVDRQRTRAEIPEIEAAVNQRIDALNGNRIHYALILKKQSEGKKLTTQEKQQLDVMDVNVKAHEDKIAEGRGKLAEMRAQLGIKD